ncbi:MAG TPA: cupin domain-containing protein [Isosphaeraceae bacterium]|nr:cupin domain-containing protein [Isosphaeraceae bacterium]
MSSQPRGKERAGARLAAAEAYFLPAGSGSRHLIFPGVELRTFAGTNLMLSVVRLEPGSVVLDHSHPHEQMGMLIEGRLEFTIGGVTRILVPGDMWRIPGGVTHRVKALDQPALALDVFHPIREDYR